MTMQWAVATLCAAAVVLGGGQRVGKERQRMSTAEQVAGSVLKIPVSGYIDFSERLQVRLVEKLDDTGFQGMALGAPTTLDIERVDRLPAILLHRCTTLRQWEVLLRMNGAIVGVDLESGELRVAQAFPPTKRRYVESPEVSMSGRKPEGLQATGTRSNAYPLEMKELLRLPWRAGRWAFTVVSYDWISNTAVVALGGQGDRKAQPPHKITAAEAAALPPAPTVPAATPGVHLDLPDSAVAASDGQPVRVAGRVQIPVPPLAVVDSRTAVVRVGVLLVDRDMKVPPLAEVKLSVSGGAAGFEVDLRKEFPAQLNKPGEYLVYAFAGHSVFGPARLRVQ